MKNLTLTADEWLIDAARETAKSQHTTLNQAFRDWLETYAHPAGAVDRYGALMTKIQASGASAGQKFTREEMNAREATNER